MNLYEQYGLNQPKPTLTFTQNKQCTGNSLQQNKERKNSTEKSYREILIEEKESGKKQMEDLVNKKNKLIEETGITMEELNKEDTCPIKRYEGTSLRGDINNDGKVTLTDVALLGRVEKLETE